MRTTRTTGPDPRLIVMPISSHREPTGPAPTTSPNFWGATSRHDRACGLSAPAGRQGIPLPSRTTHRPIGCVTSTSLGATGKEIWATNCEVCHLGRSMIHQLPFDNGPGAPNGVCHEINSARLINEQQKKAQRRRRFNSALLARRLTRGSGLRGGGVVTT